MITPGQTNTATPPPRVSASWNINTSNDSTVSGSEMSLAGYEGSMQQLLSQNTGYYVSCEFLIGTQNLVRREGILYQVGSSFMVLYDVPLQRYIICDFYALKFVTFYEPGSEPINIQSPYPLPR